MPHNPRKALLKMNDPAERARNNTVLALFDVAKESAIERNEAIALITDLGYVGQLLFVKGGTLGHIDFADVLDTTKAALAMGAAQVVIERHRQAKATKNANKTVVDIGGL